MWIFRKNRLDGNNIDNEEYWYEYWPCGTQLVILKLIESDLSMSMRENTMVKCIESS